MNEIEKLVKKYKKTIQQIHQSYAARIEQKSEALSHFKKKSRQLQKNLDNSKLFLNMVIHDLRNPSNQVQFLTKELLTQLNSIK